MTRKRFIKLCMGDGITRNASRELAAALHPGHSYDALFTLFFHYRKAVNAMELMKGFTVEIHVPPEITE